MLGGIERAYFEERGRVPADQRAESWGWDEDLGCFRCGMNKKNLTDDGYCESCVAWVDSRMPPFVAESFGAEHGSGQACCFCGDTIIGYGNNPAPLDEFPNKCCSDCNLELVIPARMRVMFEGRSENRDLFFENAPSG